MPIVGEDIHRLFDTMVETGASGRVRVRVLDFGLARVNDSSTSDEAPSDVHGSPCWPSPAMSTQTAVSQALSPLTVTPACASNCSITA